MTKLALSKLKLNKETEVIKVPFGEVEIEVKQYLPIEEKISIINIILQDCVEEVTINRAKADALLHIYMVMSYTNLSFTKKERDNLFETYDLLEKNGVIDAIINALPEVEYNAFVEYVEKAMNDYDKYKTSLLGVAEQVLAQLPDVLGEINNIMKGFDPGKLQVLSQLVNSFGGDPSALTSEILEEK